MSIDKGQREIADLAMEQWTDYKTRFKPLEKQYAADMMNVSEADRSKAIAGSMANVQKNSSQGFDTLMRQSGAAGVNPASGKSMGLVSDFGNKMGTAAGTGVAGANDAIEGRRWAGITKSMRMGRGQAAESVAGLTTSAQLRMQNEALKTQTENAIKSSNYNLYGNLAGMGAGAGMYYAGGRGYRDPNARSMVGMNRIGL